MITKTSPDDNLGGFKIISDMLTGPAGPANIDEPVLKDEPVATPDDDEGNVQGVTDFNDAIPAVTDDDNDPIVEPKVDDEPATEPVDDTVVDDEPADKPASVDGDDMSEYQEDITNYLKSELETNLGWEIPEDYEMKSMEDVVNFMSDLVKEASKPSYANDEVAKFDEFVRNGGDLRNFYQTTVENRVNTDTVDIESEFNQKIVLREHLKNQGYSEPQVERRLTRYEEAGVLEDEATDALEMLKEYNEKVEEKLLIDQQKEAERIKEQQLSFINDVEESVKGLEDIRGLKISKAERDELLDYILKQDPNGATQYQRDYMSNIQNLVESAYFTKNAQTLIDKSRKQGKTEAYRSLHQKLKTNKGNKGKSNEGRDYSDNASSGLSLIGKQLLG
jgi:hypothetical protein